MDDLSIAFDYEGEVTADDAQEILDKVAAIYGRALEAAEQADAAGRADALRLFAANLQKAFYGFEPDFFQQNLLRIVDDVVTVIKGSIELWPTLVEICYFEKNRRGLPQTRVNNPRSEAELPTSSIRLTPDSEGSSHEDRTSCPALRERPAEAVRRDRAGGVVSDRGAGPAGPRGHALRQRRFGDGRPAGPGLPAGPLAGARLPRDAAAPRPARRAGRAGGPPIRRDPLPPRLRPLPDGRPAPLPDRHDAPRPAAPARPAALLRGVPRRPAGVDLRRPAAADPRGNWQATVYHGLPRDLHTFREASGTYLAFLGRLSPEKGIEQAVEIARRAGMPLRVAAKIYPEERPYYEQVIEPLFRASPWVEFVGEVGGAAKDDFLGNAHALLFPIDWDEPFGLVMIEAMACGTPVVAFRRGSVPEVMADGVTGFVVDDVDEAVEAVGRVGRLSRRACRRVFERAVRRRPHDPRLPGGLPEARGRRDGARSAELVARGSGRPPADPIRTARPARPGAVRPCRAEGRDDDRVRCPATRPDPTAEATRTTCWPPPA